MRATRAAVAAHYGVSMLSHLDVLTRFQPKQQAAPPASRGSSSNNTGAAGDGGGFLDTVVAPLERVETIIASWKLNRWEHRVPLVAHSEMEKELARRQLHDLKSRILRQRALNARVEADVQFLCGALQVEPKDIRSRDRRWLNEKVAKMRWRGEVATAKEVRDAWARLEASLAEDRCVLKRLCCIYGLARMGTFETAFSNMILPTSSTTSSTSSGSGSGSSATLDLSDPFREVLELVVTYLPSIDVLHDFMGMNTLQGYTPALATYLTTLLQARDKGAEGGGEGRSAESASLPSPTAAAGSRVLYQNVSRGELLFAASSNSVPLSTTNPFLLSADPAPLADFVHVVGGDVTLLSVAADNVYKREVQLPNDKQLAGIARRAGFVFGPAVAKAGVRVRSLLLPPRKVDRRALLSLDRVLRLTPTADAAHAAASAEGEALDGGLSPLTTATFPWTAEYREVLDPADAEYAAYAAKQRDEDMWRTL